MSGLTTARRRSMVAGICVAGVLAAGLGTWAVVDVPTSTSAAASGSGSEPGSAGGDGSRSAAGGAGPGTPGDGRHTAPVTKGDLTDSKTIAGTLGYGAPVGLAGAASGTLTWLPKPGDVIGRDAPLYAVDERPVRTMFGTVPLWRPLERGKRGADVRQLNENLAALGYDVSVDDVFGPRTQRAVRQWQADREQEVTGVLTADDVVFVDGEVRVGSVDGTLGQPAGGQLLSVTSTKRVVTASVPQRDAERLAVGTAVTVRINGAGDAMDGTVVDSAPGESKDGGAVVDVTIAFEAGDRKLPDAASAQVDAKGQTERGVLSVPVAALVAGDGGRFAVDVVRRDGSTERVRVSVGFVAEGRAAVTGDLQAGDRVVVPS
jgi:peptidoglycan hydrolase-like protein with peptidoglycan-binding domain